MRKMMKHAVLFAVMMVLVGTSLHAQLSRAVGIEIIRGKCGGCTFGTPGTFTIKLSLISPAFRKPVTCGEKTNVMDRYTTLGFPEDYAIDIGATHIRIEVIHNPSKISLVQDSHVDLLKFDPFVFPFWDYPSPARHFCN